MNLIRKAMIILWCIIIPSTGLGMKITIGNDLQLDSLVTLEFKMDYHHPQHEIYELIQSAMDLIKLIIEKNTKSQELDNLINI